MAFSGAFIKPFRPAFDAGLAAAGNGLLNNLVAYWPLNEAAGANDALDLHTNGLTLTQAGSPGSEAGKIGTARTFVAASNQAFYRIDDPYLSTGDIDFSFAAWVKLGDKTSSHAIVSKLKIVDGQGSYQLIYNQALDRFRFVVSSDGTSVSGVNADNLGSPSAGAWYYVVAWHDAAGNTINIQVNDGTINSASYSSGVYDGTSGFLIAAQPGAGGGEVSGNFMTGNIDEVAFWKAVLSATQRTSLYNAGAGLAYAAFTT